MLTKGEARVMVVAELVRSAKQAHPSDPTDLIVIDESTIERPWGWVFFYTSEQYLRTGDVRYAVAGNAPFFVNRHTAEIRSTGTAMPIEHYMAEYERELARPQEMERPYRAMIWKKDSTSAGQRVTVLARSLEDARTQLEAIHGEGTVFNLHNESDADRAR